MREILKRKGGFEGEFESVLSSSSFFFFFFFVIITITITRARSSSHICSSPCNSRIENLSKRIIDDSDDGFLVDCEAERDGDVGPSVEEVGCAVDRVDDEGGGGGEDVAGLVGFFAHESILQRLGR